MNQETATATATATAPTRRSIIKGKSIAAPTAPTASTAPAVAVAPAVAAQPTFSRSELMKRLWADPEWRAKQQQKAQAHSARMAEKWRDPAYADRTKKSMSAARKTERVRNKMRDALMDAARRQARDSGIAPIWTPKKVASIEPTGRSFQHASVRTCAAHYGITESNMRAILKYKRSWQGIKFVTIE